MAEPRKRAPQPQAQDKLAFLLSLVPYLIDRERVSVTEVAEHFDVRPEEIRRAVRLIAISGVPGATEQYQATDLFDINWDDFEQNDHIVLTNLVGIDDSPRFSAREAAALIAGLQYLSSLPSNRDDARLPELVARLSRGASATPSAVAISRTAPDADLALLRRAIDSRVRVEFEYRNSQGETETRPVDPILVESVDTDWYLRGWCHLRRGMRTFRLDRMTGLRATATPQDHPVVEFPFPERLFEGSASDSTVGLEVARAAVPLVGDYLSGVDVADSGSGVVTAEVRVAQLQSLARLATGHAGLVTVTGPAVARRAVADWAARGLARYEGGHA